MCLQYLTLFKKGDIMNVGFCEETKELCMFDDENNGELVANFGFKLTKTVCDGCDDCCYCNPYEEHYADECPYGVEDELRLTY